MSKYCCTEPHIVGLTLRTVYNSFEEEKQHGCTLSVHCTVYSILTF